MPPLLSRLLLCALLLFNGTGAAVASTHLALAAALPHGPDRPAAAADGRADGPPHAVAAADCPHGGGRPPAAPDATAPEPPPTPDADCLKLCLDICLQHGHALPAAHAAGPLPPARTAPVPAAATGPAAVRLHPPLRPPIPA